MPGSLVCCVENEAEDRGKARQNRRRPQAAEMMDTLDLGRWWAFWKGRNNCTKTFANFFSMGWMHVAFLTPRKGEITICRNNTFNIFGFVRSVVCEQSSLLSQVDSWFECWMFFARMFSGFTYFGHPLTTQDYDFTWNDNMEIVILKIITR